MTEKITYTAFIGAPRDKVWNAITAPESTAKYFGGRVFESTWGKGDKLAVYLKDGTLDVLGKVIDADHPSRLSVTWHVEWIPELAKLPPALLTFILEDVAGTATKLTVEYGNYEEPQNEEFFEGGRQGWPLVISQLKSVIETGEPIPGVVL
jgi:uncharacterized protein YndB with AHSA1/START domain